MQLELSHKETVKGADQSADAHHDQDDQGDGQGADIGPHLVGGVAGLEQGGGHTGGDAHGPTGGQVGAGQHDAAGDAQRHRQIGRGQGQQVDQRAGGQERRLGDRHIGGHRQHNDDQGIVQQGVADLLGVNAFRLGGELLGFVTHESFPPLYTYFAARVRISSWLVFFASTSPAT